MRIASIVISAALVVTSAACGISEEVYNRDVDKWKSATEQCQAEKDEVEAARAALEVEKANLTSRVAELEGEKQTCLAQLSKVAGEKGALSGELERALVQLRQMEAIAAKQKATLDAIVSGLQSMVSAGQIKIVSRNGRLVVEIAENILFDSGRSALKAEGKEALAKIAPVLAGVKREFQVSGHTDNVGSEDFNWKLSLDRAIGVLQTMREAGYPGERISAAGYAWYQPVGTNETKEGRQLNRRVDVVLVPNLEELKLLPAAAAAPACGRYLALLEE